MAVGKVIAEKLWVFKVPRLSRRHMGSKFKALPECSLISVCPLTAFELYLLPR